jgi:tetratricopeptide (TPR) repeat protein
MYWRNKQNKEAEEVFRKSLARSNNELVHLDLGVLAFQADDYRKALAEFIDARNLRPKDDVAWRNIADCYAMLGNRNQTIANYAEAARVLNESLEVNPRRGADWMKLAFYEAKIGHGDRARDALAAAESRGAADLPSQFKKVQVLMLLGEKSEALELLLQCLDRGLMPVEVDMALDLRDLRSEPDYRRRVANKHLNRAKEVGPGEIK